MPEGARDGAGRVVVGGVGDDVDLAALAAQGVAAEPDAAVGEALAVRRPVWVAVPAVVDGVSGQALVLLLHGKEVSARE